MSFFRKIDPVEARVFEGTASLGQLADAARETALFADNVNAADNAMAEAISDGINIVRDATGIELRHPQNHPADYATDGPIALSGEHFVTSWDRRIGEIIDRNPEKAEVLAPLRQEGIRETARQTARETAERYDRLAATRDDWPGFAASLGGGLQGAIQDPATLVTLPLGIGGGAARTVGGRILQTTWREALLSGVSEAGVQPFVQKWRAEAGLPAGFDEGLKNIGMATAFGGILGAGIRAGIETPGAIRRRLTKQIPAEVTPPPVEKIVEDLAPVRDQLPPAQRAAVDIFDQDRAVIQAIRGELGDDIDAGAMRMLERSDRFAERLDASDPDDFNRFLREREFAQDPILAEDYRAAREAYEAAEARLAELEGPLKARTVADTLEEIDPQAAARIRAIEEELKGQIPKQRRAALKAERTTIVETIGEDVLERTEREFRIKPQKRVKAARKRVRETRRKFNAVSRKADARAGGRLEAGRAVQRDPVRDEQIAVIDPQGRPVAPSPAARTDPFEPDSAEAKAQVEALENEFEPEEEIADMLMIQEDGRITSESRPLADSLAEADRGHSLANLVEACKLT